MISLIKDGKYDQKSNLLQLLFNFRDIAGSDRGGIIYSQDREYFERKKSEDKSLNYVMYSKHLGDNWYYYYEYYDDIKNSDKYRTMAWGSMGYGAKDNDNWDIGNVTLEYKNNINYAKWLKEPGSDMIISVSFDGVNKTFIDPLTDEIIGYIYAD